MQPTTLPQLEEIRQECRRIVSRRASMSAGATLLPIPLADIGADVGLLMEMIPTINRRFGLTPEQIDSLDPQVKRVLLVGVSSVGSEMIGRYVTRPLILQLVKRVGVRMGTKSTIRFVPIAGQLLAAGISFAAMRAIGNAHIDDCYRVLEKAIIANLPEKVGVTRVDAAASPAY